MLNLNIDRTDIETTVVKCDIDGTAITDVYYMDPLKTDDEIKTLIINDLTSKGYTFMV